MTPVNVLLCFLAIMTLACIGLLWFAIRVAQLMFASELNTSESLYRKSMMYKAKQDHQKAIREAPHTFCLGGSQQAWYMANAACSALYLDYEMTSPNDITEAIINLKLAACKCKGHDASPTP